MLMREEGEGGRKEGVEERPPVTCWVVEEGEGGREEGQDR